MKDQSVDEHGAKRVAVLCYFDPEMLKAIDNVRFEERHESRQVAIRAIVEEGLKVFARRKDRRK